MTEPSWNKAVDISGGSISVGGDIVGRDRKLTNPTPKDLAKMPTASRDLFIRGAYKDSLTRLYQTHYGDDAGVKLNVLTQITSRYLGGMEETTVDQPVRSDSLTLINPERVIPQGAFTRSPQPEVNALTGDLRFRPDKGNFFGSIEPVVVEGTQLREVIPVTDWSYADLKRTLAEAYGMSAVLPKERSHVAIVEVLTKADINERTWGAMDQKSRAIYVLNKCQAMIVQAQVNAKGKVDYATLEGKARELWAEVTPTRLEPAEHNVGIKVEEYDSKGRKKDGFTVYLVQSDNSVRSGESTIMGRDKIGKEPKVNNPKWQIKVVCEHGDEATYNWGENRSGEHPQVLIRKPVIYVYPTQTQKIEIGLQLAQGQIVAEYPSRVDGKWTVTATPDGTLTTLDGKTYPYLFWEGVPNGAYAVDFSSGFYVPGSNVITFLEEKLKLLGLNRKEIADFITYWYPVMKKNPFSHVKFLYQEYTEKALLTVNPQPETLIRVFMAFKSVSSNSNIVEQKLTPIIRKGFTMVEWGGVNLDESGKT